MILKPRRERPRPPTAPPHLRLRCPCGKRMTIHIRHIGRIARCPDCKTLFRVPAAQTVQAPTACRPAVRA